MKSGTQNEKKKLLSKKKIIEKYINCLSNSHILFFGMSAGSPPLSAGSLSPRPPPIGPPPPRITKQQIKKHAIWNACVGSQLTLKMMTPPESQLRCMRIIVVAPHEFELRAELIDGRYSGRFATRNEAVKIIIHDWIQYYAERTKLVFVEHTRIDVGDVIKSHRLSLPNTATSTPTVSPTPTSSSSSSEELSPTKQMRRRNSTSSLGSKLPLPTWKSASANTSPRGFFYSPERSPRSPRFSFFKKSNSPRIAAEECISPRVADLKRESLTK